MSDLHWIYVTAAYSAAALLILGELVLLWRWVRGAVGPPG